MNDDIFRPEGAEWIEPARPPVEPTRPPVEPTVNVSATDGFAIDGTDGFAIDERPIEAPVDAPGADADGVPALSRGRLVATVGAALTGLLVVILVGSSTGPRPVVSDAGVLRTEDDSVTTTTAPVESTPEGAWTRSLLGLWDSSAFAPVYEFDDSDEFATGTEYDATVPYDTVYPTEFETDFESTFDSDFETSFDTDFDGSSSFPYNTLPPRRFPVFTPPSRSRFVVPATTAPPTTAPPTTAPATTAPPTTAPATTAPATTAPPTTAPPTTAKPTPTWVAARSGLPLQCPEGTRLFVRTGGVVAAVPDHGLFATANGTTWTALGDNDEGTAAFPAFVQDPSTPGRFWVAGPDGVFRTDDGGANFTELGTPNLTDVSALGVHVPTSGDVTLLAVHGPAASLSRSTDGGGTWKPVTVPIDAGVVGDVLMLDTGDALIGTDTGVYRMAADGVVAATPEHTGAVVGEPVRSADGQIVWRLADGGVIRRSQIGTDWTATPKPSVAITSLGHLADGRLAATGPLDTPLLVLSSDGTTWSTFEPKVKITPVGVAHSAEAKATLVWDGTCGDNAVMSLADQ